MARAVLVLLALLVAITPAAAQSPFTPGLSLGGSMGAPMATWQRIDPNGAFAGSATLAPAEPGYSASVAASRAIGHGEWLVDGSLDASSAAHLSSQSGHFGLTYTLPGDRSRLVQATIAAGFSGGNGVLLDSGLWPASGGRQSAVSAGLRWAAAPFATVHLATTAIRADFPIAEQELGVNSALSPALSLSLGLNAQQHAGAGMLASAAVRWQPRAQSPVAISLEGDLARGYWFEPFLPDAGEGPSGALSPLGRYSGLRTLAVIDTHISPTLALRLGASLDFRGKSAANGALGPSFIASFSHGL